jgi:hypothetical protein
MSYPRRPIAAPVANWTRHVRPPPSSAISLNLVGFVERGEEDGGVDELFVGRLGAANEFLLGAFWVSFRCGKCETGSRARWMAVVGTLSYRQPPARCMLAFTGREEGC